MMWHASEGMGWWMLFGSVFWVIVVATVVWLFARAFDGGSRAAPVGPSQLPESPTDIARRRFAAGEINEEELRHIREVLRQ